MVPDGKAASAGVKPIVAFRVDGGRGYGAGHVRRCLTLADQLAQRGAICLFVGRGGPGSMLGEVETRGHMVAALTPIEATTAEAWRELDTHADALETLAVLENFPRPKALIVDHYALSADWEKLVGRAADGLVVIDDLADRQHVANILVDPAPADAARYKHLVPQDCLLLTGPSYSLLSPEFRRWRKRQQTIDGPISRILVSFGALDSDNYAMRTCGIIRRTLGTDVLIDVVTGCFSASLEALRQLEHDDASLTLHVDTDRMPELMANADLAIGAGGGTGWERACLALPSIVVRIAENQRLVLSSLVKAGAALEVDSAESFDSQLALVLPIIERMSGLRALMGKAGALLVDGRGAVRVADAILVDAVRVRAATLADRERIWAWRNADIVRASAKSREPIPWDSHCKWYERVLSGTSTRMLIGLLGEQAVGVLRFDRREAGFLVSIFLSPEAMGLGLGSSLLRAGESWLASVGEEGDMIAEILAENSASAAAFEAAGYSLSLRQYSRRIGEG